MLEKICSIVFLDVNQTFDKLFILHWKQRWKTPVKKKRKERSENQIWKNADWKNYTVSLVV